MQADIEQIKQSANLAEVISRVVALKPAGKRLKGLCPFHPEKTPSFTVDPDKQLWHCFGCHQGGDVFHFLMKLENLTFPEAAAKLARAAGLEFRRGGDQRLTSERDRLTAINQAAADFYQRLLDSEEGQRARDYLEERGLTREVAAHFRLGFAPSAWDRLYRHLRQLGFPEEEILRAGLCVARPGGQGAYDRFRARVTFPIFNREGQVIGFGGRTMGQDEVKYLNSPETPLFHKGRTLYGLDLAARAIAQQGHAVVVEGYLDAIACHQFGFEQAVATLGTALTIHHLETLRRLTERVYLALDSDSAGMAGGLRSRPLFEQVGLQALVVRLATGQDPDQFLRSQGAQAFAGAIEAAVPLVECELEAALAGFDPAREQDHPRMIRAAVEVLASIKSPIERTQHARRLAERLSAGQPERTYLLEQAIHQELKQRAPAGRGFPSSPRGRRAGGMAADGTAAPAELGNPVLQELTLAEREALSAALTSLEAANFLLERLRPEHFPHPLSRQLFAAMQELVQQGREPTPGELLLKLDPEDPACQLTSTLAMQEVATDPRLLESLAASLQERHEMAEISELTPLACSEPGPAVLRVLQAAHLRKSKRVQRRVIAS